MSADTKNKLTALERELSFAEDRFLSVDPPAEHPKCACGAPRSQWSLTCYKCYIKEFEKPKDDSEWYKF